jgi:DNA-binding NarL/FixJ family response regulator
MRVGQPRASVLCVDDQRVFRVALRELIAATPGFTQIGEATCGQTGVVAAAELRPDLVLMDIHMPGLNGFEAARMMAQRRRDLVVILISADPPEPPAGFAPRDGQVSLVAKQELCPRTLLDLWHGRMR